MSELTRADLSNEAWREYDFFGRVYRINDPVNLYTRPGGTTHRVTSYDKHTDTIIAHCVPAPGQFGCVVRWSGRDGKDAVNF